MAKQKIITNNDGTKRGLSNRHVQMIAIGGTIGTGLFLGSGTTISRTGPSIILVYLVVGIFFFFMMRAIGEMFYSDPSQHTFVAFISRYSGPAVGHFAGWSYWLRLIFSAMAELTAVATYMHFWFPHLPAWLTEIVFLVVLTAVNLIAARLFGEAEFWFASIKIIAIVVLILTGIFTVISQTTTPLGQASIGNIFHNFSLFPKGGFNFFSTFPMVFFAFQGIEFVSITIGEAKSPHKVLKKAVNETLIRIALFYIGALIAIMVIIPWPSLSANNSPFVYVFKLAGFPAAAAIVNFVVLTSAASSLNSLLFSAGRHFYQLAEESPAKSFMYKMFARISANGVPATAIKFSAILILIGPLLSLIKSISAVFLIITGASSDMAVIVYTLTMFAHRKFRISKDFLSHGFLMPGHKITSPLTIIFFIFIFISLFFAPGDIFGAIGASLWTIIFGGIVFFINVIYKKRTRLK